MRRPAGAAAAGAGTGGYRGTVGGTLATGTAGPRRLRYGTPRDLVIGITVVRADGTVRLVGRQGGQERGLATTSASCSQAPTARSG